MHRMKQSDNNIICVYKKTKLLKEIDTGARFKTQKVPCLRVSGQSVLGGSASEPYVTKSAKINYVSAQKLPHFNFGVS